MKLSIITINRNNKYGLEKTIRSVIAQTCRDYEYIVIDGASTDGSADIIRQYEKKISCWISEPDQGIYNAMNKGILQAHGEYCLFLNSGDILYNAEALKNIRTYLDSDYPMISCRLMYQEQSDGYLPRQDFSFLTLIGSYLPHPSTLIQRKLFDQVGFYDERYAIIADFVFFFRAIVFHNIKYTVIDVPLTIFDRTGISSTGNQHIIERKSFIQNEFSILMKITYRLLLAWEWFKDKITRRTT